MRLRFLLIMILVIGGLSFSPKPAAAQTSLCFADVPGISNCISGRFLSYWQQNGGLAVFGYPLSPAQSETTANGTFTTQYFERQRFELHPELAAPYDVLLGRLGAEIYERNHGNWRNSPKTNPSTQGCLVFNETGRSVCEPFLSYWVNHGLLDGSLNAYEQSLSLLGLPLTEPRLEQNPDGDWVMTQWFERARLEDHSAKGVLLGRLGSELKPQPAPSYPSEITALVDAINRQRSQAGLSSLTINSTLNQAAQIHSDDMARNNFFEHTGSDGSNAGQRMQRVGYIWRAWAENLAAGYTDAQAIIDAWMQSPGHRANILYADVSEIGVGIARNPNSEYQIYWTVNFGAR